MAFRLVLDFAADAKGLAFARLAGVPVFLRLIIAASRHGGRSFVLRGTPEVTARARALVASHPKTCGLDVLEGEGVAAASSDVVAEAALAVGLAVWPLLDAAGGAATVPGTDAIRKVDGGDPIPAWTGDPPRDAWVVHIREREDLASAKALLFRFLRKPTSRFVAREIYSRISVPVSRLLVETPLTPNQMTLLHTALGIAGCAVMGIGRLDTLALGAAMLQLSAALDLCDGELARSKFMESEGGQWLDTIGDHSTHVAFVVGLTVGYARYTTALGVPWAPLVLPVGLSFAAVTVALIGGLVAYVRRHHLGGALSAVARDYGDQIPGDRGGWLFRTLHAVRVMGERDQFTLAITLLAVLPASTGNDLSYHLLFGTTLLILALMVVYFLVGATRARGARA